MLRRVRELPVLAILLVGLGCFVLYAYPGMMSVDSVDQLIEARAGFYTDSHPPVMAALWGVLDAIVAGPLLMLLLQGVTFLGGSYLVLARALSPRKAAVAASLVLLFPPVLTTMAFIWKDSLMAGLLLLGTGLVLAPDRRVRVAALGCFTLATAVKYNAFAAALPLIVLLFEWTPGRRGLARYAVAAATWLGVTLLATGANVALTDQPMHFWHSSLAVADIVGVINYGGEMTDAELRKDLEGTGLLVTRGIQAHARKLYATQQHLKLVLGKRRMWDLPINGKIPAPAAQRDAIAAAWWRMIRAHPSAYAHHRANYFLGVLGVTYQFEGIPDLVAPPALLRKVEGATTRFAFQERWQRLDNWYWQHTPLFWQWIYVGAALVLLPLARRRREVAALLASGIVVEASLIFLAPSVDYRYSHWTIVVTLLAAFLLASRRVAPRPTSTSAVANNAGAGAKDHGASGAPHLDMPRADV